MASEGSAPKGARLPPKGALREEQSNSARSPLAAPSGELELASPLLLAKSASISCWLKKLESELPRLPLPGASRAMLNGHSGAIETAAYALAGGKLFIGESQVH